MPDIRDQLAWEERMVDHGVSRYRGQQDKAVEGSRAEETSAGTRLLRSYILQVSDHIRLYLDGKHPDGRRRNQYAKLLATLDTDKTALFALKVVVNTLYHPQPTQRVCINIGRHIEDELKFAKFHTEHKEYYDEVIRSWKRKNTTNYKHKRNTLSVKARDLGMAWTPWSEEVLMSVGALVVSLLMEVCDLVETVRVPRKTRGHSDVFLVPTEKCIEWVKEHNALSELSRPDCMPCIIPPEDWSDWKTGGYYSAHLRDRTPLVKVRGNSSTHPQAKLLDQADMPVVLSAVNAMQKTGWVINSRVKKVMQEVWHKNLGTGMPRSQPYEMPRSPIPQGVKPSSLDEDSPLYAAFVNWKAEAREVHTLEKERVAQNLAVSRSMRMATDMEKYDAFYYVYTCDFRGRVYSATSGLSPQGTDHAKAMLQFADAKPLGPRGLYWLKVHGANKWGTDKCSRDEQVAWIEERHADWLRVSDDPIGNRSVWASADKPYQFLAFCFEYAQAVEAGEHFQSRLPIALDGTCNGLQHFSAMLRDEVGGAAVNLVPADKPSDIYQQVADVCTETLRNAHAEPNAGAGAANWLSLFHEVNRGVMPRKLSKPPVMTLPYGSTQQSCTGSVYKWLMSTASGFFPANSEFRHALYLSPILWGAIGEVVIAARAAMAWIQGAVSDMAKNNLPMQFITPLGFPVYQRSLAFKSRQIETQIGGRLRLRVAEEVDRIDVRKQRQGSSPNFVHSVDATHMIMCIYRGMLEGITSFACIHDDFGTHACDTDRWHSIIREEFVKLHGDVNVLELFKEQHEQRHDLVLPDLPPMGNLDIRDVLKSPYFFG